MSSDYPVQSQPSTNPIPENAKEKQSRAKLLASDMLLDYALSQIWAAILLLACLLALPCVRVCLLACLLVSEDAANLFNEASSSTTDEQGVLRDHLIPDSFFHMCILIFMRQCFLQRAFFNDLQAAENALRAALRNSAETQACLCLAFVFFRA